MLLCAKNQVMSSVLKFFIYRNALWVILCNRILKKININAGKFGQKLIFRKFCDTFLLSRIYQLGFPPAFMNYLQSRGLSAVKDISRRRRYCQEFEDITGSWGIKSEFEDITGRRGYYQKLEGIIGRRGYYQKLEDITESYINRGYYWICRSRRKANHRHSSYN